MKSPLLLCLTIILLAVAAPALAEANNQGVEREQQTPRVKRSWDWTVEERLNSRFSATEIAERNAAYHQTNHGLVAGSMAVSDPTSADRERVSYVIEGRRNPELFLPHEIFDSLVGAVDPRAEVRLRAQASLAPGIRALGLDDATFWLELEAAAGGYARKRIGSPPANDPTWQQSLCSMSGKRPDMATIVVLHAVRKPCDSYQGGRRRNPRARSLPGRGTPDDVHRLNK